MANRMPPYDDRMSVLISTTHDGVRIPIKAVPGAKRDAIAGPLGDRLKIKVSAPPEGGKANKAIVAMLAKALGLKPASVSIVSGQTNPEKIALVVGMSEAAIRAKLDL